MLDCRVLRRNEVNVVFNAGPTDILDHAAPVCGVGHKMGIDATRKFPEEGHPRPWPDEMIMSRNVKRNFAGDPKRPWLPSLSLGVTWLSGESELGPYHRTTSRRDIGPSEAEAEFIHLKDTGVIARFKPQKA